MPRHHQLIGACALLLAHAAAPAAGRADPPDSVPDEHALDMAPIDIATLELGVGAVSSFKPHTHSEDLRAGLIGVWASMLGIRLRALELEMTERPRVGTLTLAGTLASVDAWMIGTGNADSSPCMWWLSAVCDPDSGHLGFGGSLLGGQYDPETGRAAVRVGELRVLWSATPAFGRDWARYRFMPFIGASLDRLWDVPGLPNKWLGRGALGIDSAFSLGTVSIEPQVRWRPSTAKPVDDFGIEGTVTVMTRRSWHGFSTAGDALRFGVQLGYAYWSVAGYAYGADWSERAKSTLFIRLVVAPSLFSAVPPS